MSLAGRVIAITRPMGQFEPLASRIRAAGGIPVAAPLLDIFPLPNVSQIQAAGSTLSQFDWVIFISPNSVQHSLPHLLNRAQTWPPTTKIAGIGPGTARALADFDLPCLLPEGQRFDSEGLLARSEFAEPALRGQRILLIKGEGGRELLADTLSARGASVTAVSCYQRRAPDLLLNPFEACWQQGRLDAILLSSSEGAANLLAAASPEQRTKLYTSLFFAPHPRIVDKALSLGLHQVILTGPADDGTLAGLLAYNWPLVSL